MHAAIRRYVTLRCLAFMKEGFVYSEAIASAHQSLVESLFGINSDGIPHDPVPKRIRRLSRRVLKAYARRIVPLIHSH